MYILKHTVQLVNLPKTIGGIAINLVYHREDPISSEVKNKDAMAAITITHSSMMKVIPDMEYYGELPRSNSFSMFTVDPPAGKNLYLTYSACLGFVYVSIVDPLKPDNKEKIEFTEE